MEGKDEKKSRANSFGQGSLSLEDMTIIKLMEEIMEFDQEIKMKQKWINTRMQLLHKLLPQQKTSTRRKIIEKFLMKLQPEYPKKISITYDRSGDAIPMGMDSGDPIALPMNSGDPIALAYLLDDLPAEEGEQQEEQKKEEQ